jgi:glycosyltransferase involved in cell wall biosynthesis
VLYIGIPVFNEAPTIGVLLWQVRKVFRDFPREYEILVYEDASTDATADVLHPYTEVLPLTVLHGGPRVGYSGALDALCRAANSRTRYARRDALITMQGDFTDQPRDIPELVKRFEGGADIVVAERPSTRAAPEPRSVRRLRRLAPWLIRARVSGVSDPFGSFRLYRISVLREMLKRTGDLNAPVIASSGWSANVELLMKAAPFARRIETVTLAQRYDLRARGSRVRPFADAVGLYRFGRGA